MSTRDIAYSIFNRLSEEQLKGFIAMFRELYPVVDEDQNKRDVAFQKLQALRRSVPEFDENKELEEYRKEKYGI
ncbi:MAG: hypothetical protein IJU14_06070 [Clostridia bacterium]|nr:hypothetical protein [Clostridia bacterium]